MDRIYEAYMGEMGEAFAQKTQKRIHWICDNVQGDSILDVGCSQGITAILLARNGKTVTGLDICEEAIECANSYLAEEAEEVRNRVTFKQADFSRYTSDVRYDTIVMGEILEHLTDPKDFVENAWKHLRDQGSVIVTVPFGINDAPDHKRTYFYFELQHLLTQYFDISQTVYFGKWIGYVASKTEQRPAAAPSYDECIQLEQAFYQIERGHIDRITQLKAKYEELNQSREKQAELIKKNEALKTERDALHAKIPQIEREFYQIEKDYITKLKLSREKQEEPSKKNEEAELGIDALQAKVIQMNNVLRSSDRLLANQELLLRQLSSEIDKLEGQLAESRYNVDRIEEVLYGTWYGRFVWAAYRFLRKIKRALFKG